MGVKNNRFNVTAILAALALFPSLLFSSPLYSDEVTMERLNAFAKQTLEKRTLAAGYPCNQNTDLKEFYEWYLNSGLYKAGHE